MNTVFKIVIKYTSLCLLNFISNVYLTTIKKILIIHECESAVEIC